MNVLLSLRRKKYFVNSLLQIYSLQLGQSESDFFDQSESSISLKKILSKNSIDRFSNDKTALTCVGRWT